MKVCFPLFLLVWVFLDCGAKGAFAYAVSAFEPLVRLNTDTGAVVVIGPLSSDSTRFQTPVGMGVRPTDGAIYVDNNSPPSDDGLARLDPLTGLVTSFFAGTYNQLTFDSDGTLYTQVASSSIGTTGPIAKVNPANGIKVVLSSGQSLPRLFAFAFNPSDGFLYGISEPATPFSGSLLKIDATTGAMVGSIALSSNLASRTVGEMLFDDQGALIVSTFGPYLFDVDPTNGVATNQRTVQSGFTPQGMGYIPAPVPEPSAISLIGLSWLYLCVQRRREA
jgi:DNA-binding beta-propeller fold protein YncE